MTTGKNASPRLIDYFEGNHHVSIDEKEDSDEYAGEVKYLALDLLKAACKALLQSKTIKVYLKERDGIKSKRL